MKKLLISLISIFILSIPFISINTVFADEPAPETPWGTTPGTQWEGTPDSDIWINFWNSCLTGMGRGCLHYERIMWIDKTQPDYTATSIAQDVIFAATYMVWTVLTVIMIYCWLMYIFAARAGSDTSKYKKWLINAAIWWVLVWWAYTIVRLVQYIAKW